VNVSVLWSGRYKLCGDVGLPAGCRRALEAMSAELNGMNPAFTIRRNMQHALDDRILVDELRKVIDNMSLLNSFII